MMRSGIDELDDLIGGGLRDDANILLMGPPGQEKTLFALQFVNEGLTIRQPCVYLTTDVSPAEVESKAGEFGWNFPKFTGNGLWFVDCYSWALGAKSAQRKDIMVPGPSALNDLSIGLAQALQEAYKPALKSRVVFQSLSTLLLYNNPDIVFRFTQVIGARLKSAQATTLFMLDTGMHDERVLVTLKHLVDLIIEMKFESNKWYVSAPLSGLTEWVNIRSTKKGLEVLR
ncbi:MAG: RAD55 family ATPase [Candidatus Micrarchaeota archaeon]